MDYFLDTEHHASRDDVRRFAEQEVRPRVHEIEERRAVEVERARDRRAGWFGVTIARLYGGNPRRRPPDARPP